MNFEQHTELQQLRTTLVDSLHLERRQRVMTESEQLEEIRFQIQRTVNAIDRRILSDQPARTQ
ncbi:hypothetical protein F3N42_04195 [Marinihelvus fidelis]|uniref:Uncharacterized protein n=1 Tax=Marinihelvus fidelis TaxID=2613842 RepID=A0A5N0TI65_9GAMM|nr:hypothetical protein [Marinihelvus fidelis]KAA9133556.1 hypothetical protein F3N42_04195 [Marinihelvus fidelis]